jgi:hypothetical protein
MMRPTVLQLHAFARGGGGLDNAQRGASFLRAALSSQLGSIVSAATTHTRAIAGVVRACEDGRALT